MLYSAGFAGPSRQQCWYVLPSEGVLSPILVRPVREQLEHDRVIRLLQAKYKRKFEVAINPGNEQTMPVGNDGAPWFPDLVLQSQERGHKLLGVVEHCPRCGSGARENRLRILRDGRWLDCDSEWHDV